MFIRTKKINNCLYGYLVENVWTEKGSRQKVKAYLGKIIPLQREKPIQEHPSQSISKGKTAEAITNELIQSELKNHGFQPYPEHLMQLIKDFIIYNTQNHTLKEKKKDIVLKINEGYLCIHTIQQLTNELKKGILKDEEEQRERAVQLAEAFVAAGLNISQENFIKVFELVTKNNAKTEEKEQ